MLYIRAFSREMAKKGVYPLFSAKQGYREIRPAADTNIVILDGIDNWYVHIHSLFTRTKTCATDRQQSKQYHKSRNHCKQSRKPPTKLKYSRGKFLTERNLVQHPTHSPQAQAATGYGAS